jgi:hypothetical protein
MEPFVMVIIVVAILVGVAIWARPTDQHPQQPQHPQYPSPWGPWNPWDWRLFGPGPRFWGFGGPGRGRGRRNGDTRVIINTQQAPPPAPQRPVPAPPSRPPSRPAGRRVIVSQGPGGRTTTVGQARPGQVFVNYGPQGPPTVPRK